MRSLLIISLAGITLLTGCSSLPPCGTPEAQGQACSLGLGATLANSGIQPQPSRDYAINPITLPAPAPGQSAPVTPTGEQYQTIAVNTPSGIVYKRCKVLSGRVVACF